MPFKAPLFLKNFLQGGTTITVGRTWALKLNEPRFKSHLFNKNESATSKDLRDNLKHFEYKNNDIHRLKHIKYIQIWDLIMIQKINYWSPLGTAKNQFTILKINKE